MGVTAPQHLLKQPSETRTYAMDFANLMSASEFISTVSIVGSGTRCEDTSSLTITDIATSGLQAMKMTIAGGTNAQAYRIEVKVTTSNSQILEGDGILQIKDH